MIEWFVGSILLVLMILIVNDPIRTEALRIVAVWWGGVAIGFLISFSYALWPKPRSKEGNAEKERKNKAIALLNQISVSRQFNFF